MFASMSKPTPPKLPTYLADMLAAAEDRANQWRAIAIAASAAAGLALAAMVVAMIPRPVPCAPRPASEQHADVMHLDPTEIRASATREVWL